MSLLKNSIESIQVGVEDYVTKNPKRYLSSVRNISAGILLLYKEKLRQMSPSNSDEILLKQHIRPALDCQNEIIFIGKGRKTVDVQGIKDRFKSMEIDVEWDKFDELNRLRNEIEHYYTEKSSASIREIVAKSFVLIRDFLSTHLEKEPFECLGSECWSTLLETSEVYQAEVRACKKSLSKIDWKYPSLLKALSSLRCPVCKSNLVKTEESGDYSTHTELLCSSCGEDFTFGDVLQKCLVASMSPEIYSAIRNGWDSPLDLCPSCNSETYMTLEGICASCEYELEYTECYICDVSLSLDEQCFGGLCGFCQYTMSKDD